MLRIIANAWGVCINETASQQYLDDDGSKIIKHNVLTVMMSRFLLVLLVLYVKSDTN